MIKRLLLTGFLSVPLAIGTASAQDTIRVSAPDFLRLGMERSGLSELSRSRIDLAENRYRDARLQRIVPRAELTTQHGLVPGVKRTSDVHPYYGQDALYLDPTLRNDWADWGVFNRAEITAFQPVYTWGALSNAIQAAKAGTHVARFDHETEMGRLELRLFELYQSRQLGLELGALVEETRRQLDKAETELEKILEEGEQDLSEADLYEFRLFKYEFNAQVTELDENQRFVESAWNLAVANGNPAQIRYWPTSVFLDPIDTLALPYPEYERRMLAARPDLRKMDAVNSAADHGLAATQASMYPAVLFGFGGAISVTPNRPRQANPFIQNVANYRSIRYGIGIRQNLSFGLMRNSVDRARLQVNQARMARDAAYDQARLELMDRYRAVVIAASRYRETREMVTVSTEWLRQEQINYDLMLGEVKDLVTAVRKNLELQVQLKQRTYELNIAMARLHQAAGIPLTEWLQTE